MSYNNYVDADAAWRSANDFSEPCVAIIKHANPCGIADRRRRGGRAPQGALRAIRRPRSAG
jgi:AICAR transformylase/IMP cyclohydrolase PurH